MYHVEVVLSACSSQQIPYEDAPVVTGRQDDSGIEGVGLKDEHLRLMTLRTTSLLSLWPKTAEVVIEE